MEQQAQAKPRASADNDLNAGFSTWEIEQDDLGK
jgi:hypothetical protein